MPLSMLSAAGSDVRTDANRRILKRAKEMKCPATMRQAGLIYYSEDDQSNAFKFLSSAAELNDAEAHWYLAGMCGPLGWDESKLEIILSKLQFWGMSALEIRLVR